MAHNSRVRPFGTWTLASVLAPAEAQQWDSYVYESINGDQGGTWAPANVIVIGGAGVSITGASEFSDVRALNVTTADWQFAEAGDFIDGFRVFGGTATWQTGSTLLITTSATLTVEGALGVQGTGVVEFFSGASIVIYGGSSILNDGATTYASSSTCTYTSGATCTFASGSILSIAGTATMSGTWTQTGTHIKSGSGGRTRKRVSTAATNGTRTFDVTADIWKYEETAGVTRSHILRNVTSPVPSAGEEMEVHVSMPSPTTGTIEFLNESSGQMVSRSVNGSASHRFFYDGSKWRCAGVTMSSATISGGGSTNIGLDAYG